MGQRITKLNPFRNFNIESRVEKVISKEKPLPAPKYKPDTELYEQVLKGNIEVEKKSQQLDDNLRNIYVKSFDPKVAEHKYQKESYPQDRGVIEDFDFGFKDPKNVPPGKMLIKQALQFINNFQAKPRDFDFEGLSKKTQIPEEKLRTIVKYFKIFEIKMPDETGVKFAERMKPQIEVVRTPKQLEDK